MPWQLTFMAVALLSVPLFFLLLLVRDPARLDGNVVLAMEDAPPALEIFGFLKANARVFFPLFFGFSCFAAAQFGLGAWAPSYFIRVHDWDQMQLGQYFGPVLMFAGLDGVVSGGFIAERRLARGMSDATLRVPVIAICAAIPVAIVFPLMPSAAAALALLALLLFLGTIPFGAGVSTFPLITPNRMRAQMVAVYLLTANLLDYSAGPFLIAAITDGVFADPNAIDHSLAIVPPAIMAVGIVFILFTLKPYQFMMAAREPLEN